MTQSATSGIRPRAKAGTSSATLWVAALLVALACCLSYYVNIFGVRDPGQMWVDSISEELVLNGMEHARTHDDAFPLGYQASPDHYRPYRSQYGLQGVMAIWLDRLAGLSPSGMRLIQSLLLSAVLAGLFVVVSREFGLKAGVWAAVSMMLSSWLVQMGRDLYWVVWSWYLPLLLCCLLAPASFRGAGGSWLLLLSFGLALLVKCLCGYEFISSIVIAAMAPVVYYGLSRGFGWRATALRVVAMGVVSVVALVAAMAIHSTRFNSDAGAASYIESLVQKRLYSRSVAQVAQDACHDEMRAGPDCVEVFTKSLTTGVAPVIVQYLAFRDFLPWLSRTEEVFEPNPAYRTALLARWRADGLSSALGGLRWEDVGSDVVRAVNTIVFLLLLFLCLRKLWRLRGAQPALPALFLFAFAAPMSWFVLAKAHSYIHVQINYVLWYLPLVPVMMIVLAERPGLGRHADSPHRPIADPGRAVGRSV